MEKSRLLKKPQIFYGYWIVVATFALLFLQSGLGYYAFSLFVKPLEVAFGWSRSGVMVAFAIYFGVQAVASPFIGRIVDRYGARWIIAIGAVITGLGFVLLSQTHALWGFYIGYAVLGAGHVTGGHVPASAIVSNWFRKRRGFAIGIMGIGIGLGGLVVAPTVGGWLIPDFGWSTAYIVLAVLTWVVTIPLALWVIKTKPADMGLYPDGLEAPEAVAAAKALPPASAGFTPKMALATSAFWLITGSFFASSFGQVGIVQNQVPYLEDNGFSVAMAAAALGAVGLGSSFGKFGFGWLCDRIAPKYACAIGLGCILVAIILLMSVQATSPPALIWLYAIIMGLGLGSWLPTMSTLTSTTFGLTSYGAIWGMITGIHGIGTAVGPLIVGYIYDTMGSYDWAFIVALVLLIVAIVAVVAVRRPKPL